MRQPDLYSKKSIHKCNLRSPIYFFEDADGKNKMLLGGKGAGLIEMTKLGLPVPAGFIITTNVCSEFYQLGQKLPSYLMDMVISSIKRLEKKTGKIFGGHHNPLLVSVRSGAAISMPGMMDTILNLGLNDSTIEGLVNQRGEGGARAEYDNTRFAWNSYKRFVKMFGRIVLGVQEDEFKDIDKILLNEKGRIPSSAKNNEEAIDDGNCQQEGRKRRERKNNDEDSSVEYYYFQNLISKLKAICKQKSGKEFPDDPYEQLRMAIEAVFRSWMGRRAVEYRKQYNITPDLANGTTVIVCEMVFGNMDDNSATGVVFTRNPETGEKKLYGEYLVNAQGEDVVSGEVTPKHITPNLSKEFPQVYAQILKVCDKLEKYFKEPQDIEFTIEKGKLYILQTRTAKMNGIATVKTSIDMHHEGLINKKESIMRIDTKGLEQFLYPRVDNIKNKSRPIAKGIGASPGVATGIAIFETDKAEALGKKGEKIILIREETKPEDVPAFFQSSGILTNKGGKTSHAAVVARGIGKPCVVGCSQISIDEKEKKMVVAVTTYVSSSSTTSKEEQLKQQQQQQKEQYHYKRKQIIITEGQKVTIDGTSGDVYDKEVPTIQSEFTQELKEVVQWATEFKRIGIRANADTVQSAVIARKFGAEGIGLLRTERMFNQSDRLGKFVKIILATNIRERRDALEILGPLQKSDFKEILKVMAGFPVTIRLLDAPLHEFLPREQDLLMQSFELKTRRADGSGETETTIQQKEAILKRVRELSEVNPMLGHRGVRVAISFPEIYEMQIKAICESTAELLEEGVSNIRPQIMIPQVGIAEELLRIRSIFNKIIEDVQKKYSVILTPTIKFGSMIEVVRSCLIAAQIARVAQADFISFGTNDLTQATFSFSREDAEGKFLPLYLNMDIFPFNPFQHIDTDGVGELMKIAVKRARKAREGEEAIEIGVCGEHGGDPQSIDFCDNVVGVDYVSASVNRIPIAIIAAAQSAITRRRSETNYK